jgi:hypothetical protein
MRRVLQGLSIALVALVLLLPGQALADRRGGHGRGDHGFGHRGSHHGFGHHGGRSHRHHFRDHRHFGHHGSWRPHFRPGFRPGWHWSGRAWEWGPGRAW